MVIHTEDEHPYSGVTVEEWGAANCRLMNFILQSGQLRRDHVEYYLAYSTMIYEFVSRYDWESILDFDNVYRELQAEYNFMWGTFSSHLELQILRPKKRLPPRLSSHRNSNNTRTAYQSEDCRLFKTHGSCPYGDSCRYRHTPSTQTHKDDPRQSNFSHSGSKNGFVPQH